MHYIYLNSSRGQKSTFSSCDGKLCKLDKMYISKMGSGTIKRQDIRSLIATWLYSLGDKPVHTAEPSD